MSRNYTKPTYYPPLPFHAIRAISFISAIIVTSILMYFCSQLKHDGYKLPWTFLIVLAATLLNLLTLLITGVVHCILHLSPLFNIIINIPLALIWLVGFSLLSWNIFGTLGHTCTIANWASDQGVKICQTYKALYTFTLFGTLAHIAQIVLDGRARRTQVQSGKYNKMVDPPRSDIKAEPVPVMIDPPADNASYPLQQFREDTPSWRPGQATTTPKQSHEPHGYGDTRHPTTIDQFPYQNPARNTGFGPRSHNHEYDGRRRY